MAMLLKLQESANFVESPEGDLSGEPNFQATLWSSHHHRDHPLTIKTDRSLNGLCCYPFPPIVGSQPPFLPLVLSPVMSGTFLDVFFSWTADGACLCWFASQCQGVDCYFWHQMYESGLLHHLLPPPPLPSLFKCISVWQSPKSLLGIIQTLLWSQ